MFRYTDIQVGGSSCDGPEDMYIMLYPNKSHLVDDVKPGSDIVDSLLNFGDRCLNNNAVDYYEVKRVNSDYLGYPDVDMDADIGDQFESWLEGGNDQNDDLYGWRGAHVLVHNQGDIKSKAGGEENDEKHDIAFAKGNIAWTPRCAWNDPEKRKCSAIQETIHQFVNVELQGVKDMAQIDDEDTKLEYDEHVLGKITNDKMTPFMTYHGDEETKRNQGHCDGTNAVPYGYLPEATPCTIEAVKITADNTDYPSVTDCGQHWEDGNDHRTV